MTPFAQSSLLLQTTSTEGLDKNKPQSAHIAACLQAQDMSRKNPPDLLKVLGRALSQAPPADQGHELRTLEPLAFTAVVGVSLAQITTPLSAPSSLVTGPDGAEAISTVWLALLTYTPPGPGRGRGGQTSRRIRLCSPKMPPPCPKVHAIGLHRFL
ncbi:hypothetical protein SKAU_G00051380 [Synaphobranchus kaupii]|uniref:Uncharacterized protein n=1 Tax=Synaphobranchus kaupii TaxID=118154 RepID=A0A9Q1G322_SYNKA|nr:hypothetical protein SKAU_G00051380 [Synaphobranchus kaupii]